MALDDYDDDFDSDGMELEPEQIADGEYDMEIMKAELVETKQSGKNFINVEFRFIGGQYDGSRLAQKWWITDTDSLKLRLKELGKLGFDCQTWNKKHGKKISEEMPKAVKKMPGIRVKVAKATNANTPGKVYHNVYLRSTLAGFSAKDNPAPPVVAEVPEDPFADPVGVGGSGAGAAATSTDLPE